MAHEKRNIVGLGIEVGIPGRLRARGRAAPVGWRRIAVTGGSTAGGRIPLFLFGGAICATARVAQHHEPLIAHFNTDDLGSLGLLRPHNREIDLGLKGDVEIIRQDVDGHMCNNFANLRFRKPSLLYLVEIGVTDVSMFLQ